MGTYQRQDFGQKSGEDGILHDEISSINFRVYSSQELLQLSTCNVVSPRSFDYLHHPIPGGLYDLRMGPFSDRSSSVCLTCHLRCEHCPGHLGHIEIPLPVCHPLFYQNIHALLKMTCMSCHRFRSEEHIKKLFLVQNKLLDKGLIIAAQRASEFVILPNKASKDKEKNATTLDKEEGLGKFGTQNIDVAMIVSKLNNFLKEQLEIAEGQFLDLNWQTSTQSIESLRKVYTKEFRSQNTRSSTCQHCGAVTKSIVLSNSRFIYEGIKLTDEDLDLTGPGARKKRKNAEREKSELNPQEIKDHFRQIWGWDPELLSYLFPMLKHAQSDFPPDLFFVDVLGVPPPKTRPCQMTGEIMTINPQSTALEKVIENIVVLKQIMQVVNGVDIDSLSDDAKALVKTLKGDTPLIKMDEVWRDLQIAVNSVLDREMNKNSTGQGWGLKQLVERKQGLFRMHMMGKRVNFACRTVITPDPNIAIDEIGVPDVFAKKLTYRVPVTPWNVEELRDLVRNGPLIHPGAVCIEDADGKRVNISGTDPIQRIALSKTLLISTSGNADSESTEVKSKFVHRHLRNGDAMLLNRQPTLHKPSIMSHRARVLKGERVMRLHYAVCKSYNADFDGDEMNAHFPQNEVARAEAYNIANVCKQYLVPKDGTPLQGLIQDHIIAGVKMTVRGRFFTRSEYQQFVFYALVDFPGCIKTLPPAILKPVPLWSGKQIISTVILNLVPKGKHGPTLVSYAKIKGTEWQVRKPRKWKAGGTPFFKDEVKDKDREMTKEEQDLEKKRRNTMTEAEVIFSKGEFVAGILDKNQYGATQFSLVHSFFELYGGEYSGKLQSSFSKLFTNFLHTEGFTLGVKDILVTDEANQERRNITEETNTVGNVCAANGVNLKMNEDFSEEELRDRLERYHRETRAIPKRRIDIDLAYKEKLLVANDAINKACLPGGLIEKFPDNNLQLMVLSGAKGSSVNTMQISCLLGQIELEGKRPPLMISGKALPSFRPYETHPRAGGFIFGRFMTGIRPQEFFFHCMAGREGLVDTAVKTSRSGYLQRCLVKLLEGLVVNYDMTVRDSDKSIIQFQYGEDSLDVCKSQYLIPDQMKFLYENRDIILDSETLEKVLEMEGHKGIKKHKRSFKKWVVKNDEDFRRRLSGFALFTRQQEIFPQDFGRTVEGKKQLVEHWRSMDDAERLSHTKDAAKCPDPVPSVYRPDSNFGSVTETIDQMIEEYVTKQINLIALPIKGAKEFKAEEFRRVMRLKFQTAIVDAGEPVGVLAAQSVGEPSTQMTLNTFHFAGRGEMNVTLGIPRLREILMVASANIKTPTMTIPFLPEVTFKEREALRTSLNRVSIADVLSEVLVSEGLHIKGLRRERRVTIRFEFLERKAYSENFCVKPAQILSYFEKTFIVKIFMPVLSAVMKDRRVLVESGSDNAKRIDKDDDGLDNNQNAEAEEIDRIERQGVGEGHASSDEEELADDADATETRKKNRQMDEEAELEMDDEDMDVIRNMDLEEEEADLEFQESFTEQKINLNATRENIDDGFEDMLDEEDLEVKPDEYHNLAYAQRKTFVLNMVQGKSGNSTLIDYSFDEENELWCELVLAFGVNQRRIDMSNVIKKAAEKGVIHQVKNIRRAFGIKQKVNKTFVHFITTEGVNVDAMFARETLLDVNRLFCNNVHDMAKYYGIEAANKTIVREIKNVFQAYGIEVNPRHLSLVADYMTFDGTYKPFNRIGIENNPSPLQQMTFETAIGFLRSATLSGKCDTLDSPSAKIVVGKPCYGGTGTFNMRQQLLGTIHEDKNPFCKV